MPGAVAGLDEPLRWVEEEFQRLCVRSSSGVGSVVSSALSRYASAWDSAPPFAASDFPTDGRLLRVAGMVQDMPGPEYFLGGVRVAGEAGKGGDAAASRLFQEARPGDARLSQDENEAGHLAERFLYRLVPVPGQAEWLPPTLQGPVTAKVYDPKSDQGEQGELGEQVKLNAVVECLGVGAEAAEEGGGRVLHVLAMRPLADATLFRGLPVKSGSEAGRSLALRHLGGLVGGDGLAAELLLLALASSTHTRYEGAGIGALCLNLHGLTPSEAAGLGEGLSAVVGRLAREPLSVSALNQASWAPWKDYDKEALAQARLQLSGGSVLVVDETAMAEGRLDKTGLGNLQALKGIVARQTLDYDFHYHSQTFETDVVVVCASEGKSLLQMEWRCKVARAEDAPAPQALSEDEANAVRAFLSNIRSGEYGIPGVMEAVVETDFVERRKVDAAFQPQDLQRLLSIARALTLSHGEAELSRERWEETKRLELARIARHP